MYNPKYKTQTVPYHVYDLHQRQSKAQLQRIRLVDHGPLQDIVRIQQVVQQTLLMVAALAICKGGTKWSVATAPRPLTPFYSPWTFSATRCTRRRLYIVQRGPPSSQGLLLLRETASHRMTSMFNHIYYSTIARPPLLH